MNLGPTELLIILLVILLLFGGTKLPKLARSLGQAQSEFKKGTIDGKAEEAAASQQAAQPAPEPAANPDRDDATG